MKWQGNSTVAEYEVVDTWPASHIYILRRRGKPETDARYMEGFNIMNLPCCYSEWMSVFFIVFNLNNLFLLLPTNGPSFHNAHPNPTTLKTIVGNNIFIFFWIKISFILIFWYILNGKSLRWKNGKWKNFRHTPKVCTNILFQYNLEEINAKFSLETLFKINFLDVREDNWKKFNSEEDDNWRWGWMPKMRNR